mmetsp:Transcript_18534/g.20608  ORF Transcript_18534/g.20608 Transcript_18534/m.20608 type:complete len:413 (-) Transcript_18534:55-1293(-)
MAFKKFKHGLSKAKDATVHAFHRGPQGKDEEFNIQYRLYKNHYEALKKLDKHITAYSSAVQHMLDAQKQIAEDLNAMFAEDPEQIHIRQFVSQYFEATSAMSDAKRDVLDETNKTEIQDPINHYLMQFREIGDRCKERNKRYMDKHKLENDLAKYRAKGDPRIAGTERKLEGVAQSYEDVNQEIIKDIPILYNDRGVFLEPVLALFVDGQVEFSKVLQEHMLRLQQACSSIDKQRIHSHPPVITPRENSAVTKVYTTGPGQVDDNPFANQSVALPTHGTDQPAGSPYSRAAPTPQPQGGGNPYSRASPVPTPQATYGAPAPQPGYSAPAPQPQGTGNPYGRAVPPPRNAGPPPRSAGLGTATALWDFAGVDATELSFKAGDKITVLEKMGPEWWRGELRGAQGLFPANYVKM